MQTRPIASVVVRASYRRRLRGLFVAALMASSSTMILGTNVDASTSAVTIKARLGASYRLLAVTKAGKSFVANSSGGRVTLKGMTRSETSGMTLSVVNTSGAYVGPVMLKYITAKKAKTSSPSKAAAGYIKMKRASKATIDLGKITTKANFAYPSKAPSTTGSSIKVANGVPPARDNLGKGSGVSSGGVRSMADPTENALGDDADKDGLPAFADVDDDNDGTLDLVDPTFFQQNVKDDGSSQGKVSMFTALICGGDCVNLNAYNLTSPSGTAETRLNKMINTFQGIFFQYRTAAQDFPTRSDRNFGYFNVDCTGIAWCSGDSSKAVTISPDFDESGSQPAGNALPLKAGETDYKLLCGNNVIAKDPVAAKNPSYTGPSNWPLNEAGTGTAYDRSMDEWVFKTCDPDGDGFPNIIPSKMTVQSGENWQNEIKPRMAGPNGMKVGDTIRFNITDSSKKTVVSATQVVSGVIQTAPSIRSWNGTTLHNSDGTYNPGSIAGMSSAAANPGDTATITFWRPQRAPIGSETTWQDVGGLGYALSGTSSQCTIVSATTSDGKALSVVSTGKGQMVADIAADATPNPANYITMVVSGLANCMKGQMRLGAMDRSGNGTFFNWGQPTNQQGQQQGQPGQPAQPGQPNQPVNPPPPSN